MWGCVAHGCGGADPVVDGVLAGQGQGHPVLEYARLAGPVAQQRGDSGDADGEVVARASGLPRFAAPIPLVARVRSRDELVVTSRRTGPRVVHERKPVALGW